MLGEPVGSIIIFFPFFLFEAWARNRRTGPVVLGVSFFSFQPCSGNPSVVSLFFPLFSVRVAESQIGGACVFVVLLLLVLCFMFCVFASQQNKLEQKLA